jgi:hypothetical protein
MAKAQQMPEDQEAPATSAQVAALAERVDALAGLVMDQIRVVHARLDNSRARSRNKSIVLANAPLPLTPLVKDWPPAAGGAAVGTLPPQPPFPDDEGAIGAVSRHSPTGRLCDPERVLRRRPRNSCTRSRPPVFGLPACPHLHCS